MSMEQLSWLPKTLTDIAFKLFSDRKDERRDQKLRYATLVGQIADCIKEIGISIREDRHPENRCAELTTYINNVRAFTADITDDETAASLMFWLYHVSCVPGTAKINLEEEIRSELRPSIFRGKRRRQSDKVLEIAGHLKATSNLLKL